MSTTSSSLRHLSRRATALATIALAVFGSAAFTTAANANFTLNHGTLSLTNGSGTTDPPAGSWVTLPSDNPATTGPYFTNPSTSWTGTADGKYTLIRNGDPATGLKLGTLQPAGGIFGSTTDTFNGLPFTAITTTGGATPTLTFAGSDSAVTSRQLTFGDLSALRIKYNGATYDVGTTQAAGGKHIVPLTGSITGNATTSATITLEWTSDLVEPGFSPYQAHFRLIGTYTP